MHVTNDLEIMISITVKSKILLRFPPVVALFLSRIWFTKWPTFPSILIWNPEKPGQTGNQTKWTNGSFYCFSFLFSTLQIVTALLTVLAAKSNEIQSLELFSKTHSWTYGNIIILFSYKNLTGRSQRWGWIYNSILGFLGTFLNGYVLCVFIRNEYEIIGL